jgi:cytochrome c
MTTPGSVSVNAANVGDPSRGKDLFAKRCGGCHSLDVDKEGPRLRNVYGRQAGSISSFKYSDALKGAQITWDQNLLDKWLISTESIVPDNDMDFHVPKADERADIIEFLRASAGK